MRFFLFLSLFCSFSLLAQVDGFSDLYTADRISLANHESRSIDLDTNSFSHLIFSNHFPKAQLFNVIHFQKLNPYFNINIDLKKYSSQGIFINQEAKSHQFDFLISFRNKSFNSLFHFGSDNYDFQENGGVSNFDIQSQIEPVLFDVNLNDARNFGKNRYLNFSNSFSFNNSFSLVHELSFFTKDRSFINNNLTDDFYPNIFIDSLSTSDTTHFGKFVSHFGFDYSNFSLRYLYSQESNYHLSLDSLFSDHGLSLFSKFNINAFKLGLDAKFFLLSERSASLFLNAKDLNLTIESGQYLAPVFSNHYRSNHFMFNNDFKKTAVHKAELDFNFKKLVFKSNLTLLDDYIYLDQNQHYLQLDKLFFHSSSILFWHCNIKAFNFSQSLKASYSSDNKVFRVPSYHSKTDLNVNLLLFQNNLDFTIGSKLDYFSSYKANAYSPALASAYLQDDQLIGNYPFLTAYGMFSVESLVISLEYRNLFDKLNQSAYYYLPSYPYYGSPFQLSLSWKL